MANSLHRQDETDPDSRYLNWDSDEKPFHFIECKLSDRQASPPLRYLKQRFVAIPAIQVILTPDVDVTNKDDIRICSADIRCENAFRRFTQFFEFFGKTACLRNRFGALDMPRMVQVIA